VANRETQVVIEIPKLGSPNVRETQVAVESAIAGFPRVIASQIVVEVLLPKPPGPQPEVIQEMILP
jgi:hypothetical protein